MTDLYINLPYGVQSDTIPLERSDEARDDDILQRAVTLLLLRKDTALQYNGDSILRMFRKSTSAIPNDARDILGPIGEALKLRLNSEQTCVSSVVFSFGDAASAQSARLILTVTKINGDTDSTVLV